MPRINTPDDIWSRYAVDDNGCWNWTMTCSPGGYGKTYWAGKDARAHRVAFFLTHGWWPKMVLHKCDNPSCINPEHLEAGEHKKNMKQMADRNRAAKPKGIKHPMNKYTEAQILRVRKLNTEGHGPSAIEQMTGVHRSYVRDVVNRKRWRHI